MDNNYPEYPRTGKWTNIRTRYLEENQPERLKEMEEQGTLKEYMNRIEDEYNIKFRRLEEERLKKSMLEYRYSQGELSQMEFVGEYNQIRMEITELLTAELCKQ